MITNNYQNQLNYGAVKDVVPQQVGQRLPQSVQNFDVRETVGENTVVKATKDANMDPLTIGMTGGIWLLFAQVCQKLNNSLNNDWDKSWLGKIATKAENFATKHNLNKNESAVKKWLNGLFDKSKVLRTLKTPTRPQNSMAISQSKGITSYVMSDVSSMLGYHLKNGGGDDIIDVVKNLGTGLDPKTGKEALGYIDDLFKNCEQNKDAIGKLIKELGKKDVNVTVKNIIGSNSGFRIPNIPWLARKGSFKEMANKLNAVFGNEALGSQVTKLGKGAPKQVLKTLEGLTNGGAGGKLLIVIQATIFAQAIKKAIDAPEGEKLSTFTENIANDFGFFLSLPFQVKASHTLGGLKYIGAGGGKNTAEQIKNVEKYHSMIKTLNEKVAQGTISRIDYTKEAAAIKKFLKGDSKWYHKPLKAIGKFFSTGLDAETIKPFINKSDKSLGTSIYNGFKGLANKIKGPGVGTVLRFAVGTMIAGPIIAKGITKISHLIFGRPSKSVLDKEEPETDKTAQQGAADNPLGMTQEEFLQKLTENPELIKKLESDPQFLNQLLSNPQMFAQILNGEVQLNDLLKNDPRIINSKYITMPNAQNPQTTQPEAIQPVQNQQYPQAPAAPQGLNAQTPDDSQSKMDLFGLGKKKDKEETKTEDKKESDSLEPERSYIPSSAPAIAKGSTQEETDPKIANALARADKAEKEALERLGSL